LLYSALSPIALQKNFQIIFCHQSSSFAQEPSGRFAARTEARAERRPARFCRRIADARDSMP
jgi:hypothetical protein